MHLQLELVRFLFNLQLVLNHFLRFRMLPAELSPVYLALCPRQNVTMPPINVSYWRLSSDWENAVTTFGDGPSSSLRITAL